MYNKYIHIGFPKNFSTSLQRSYFSIHPELNHLGIGLNNNNLGYLDTTIEKALELYLKTAKDYKYKEVEPVLKKHFLECFNKAKSIDKKTGISAEHLSFSFSYDSISSQQKAERIYDLFGKGTAIIIIIRNQFDLIKSLYRESIRVGYAGSFKEYLYLFFKYQDRNYYYDIAYSNIINTYAKLFGEDAVHVLFFEKYRNKDKALTMNANNEILLIHDLNKILGVKESVAFNHYNEALSQSELEMKRKLNAFNPHDLSNHLLESAEKHRIHTYLEQDLNLYESEQTIYEDVLVKRKLISESKSTPDINFLDYTCNQELKDRIQDFYIRDNLKLKSFTDISSFDEYFKKWD